MKKSLLIAVTAMLLAFAPTAVFAENDKSSEDAAAIKPAEVIDTIPEDNSVEEVVSEDDDIIETLPEENTVLSETKPIDDHTSAEPGNDRTGLDARRYRG